MLHFLLFGQIRNSTEWNTEINVPLQIELLSLYYLLRANL
jgi:hypothetical protein